MPDPQKKLTVSEPLHRTLKQAAAAASTSIQNFIEPALWALVGGKATVLKDVKKARR